MTKHSIPCEMINRNSKNTLKNKKTRELRMESLECRQLLSVSPSAAPSDDVETVFAAPAELPQMDEPAVIMNFSEDNSADLLPTAPSTTVNTAEELITAITNAAEGDTIVLEEGSYTIDKTYMSIAKGITIKGAEGANVIIDACFELEAAVTLENLKIQTSRLQENSVLLAESNGCILKNVTLVSTGTHSYLFALQMVLTHLQFRIASLATRQILTTRPSPCIWGRQVQIPLPVIF